MSVARGELNPVDDHDGDDGRDKKQADVDEAKRRILFRIAIVSDRWGYG